MTSWNNSRRWPFQLYCPRTQDLGDIVGLIDDHVDAKSRVQAAANVLTWPEAPVVLPVCTTGFHRCAHRMVELGVSVHRWASSVAPPNSWCCLFASLAMRNNAPASGRPTPKPPTKAAT